LAGEVEARAAASRAGLDPEARQQVPFWLSHDVPEDRQIVQLRNPPIP
jgi:hypothetical protein